MSRFVPAGVGDTSPRSEEWFKAQQAVEAKQLEKQIRERQGTSGGEKSLYETLQANKAAKQEAFEESIKLKNQFRSLDVDEVDFLENVNEVERTKELEIKKDTSRKLKEFKDLQARHVRDILKAEEGSDGLATEDLGEWTVGKKRKKSDCVKSLLGVKVRRLSDRVKEDEGFVNDKKEDVANKEVLQAVKVDSDLFSNKDHESIATKGSKEVKQNGLGLGGYSSDED